MKVTICDLCGGNINATYPYARLSYWPKREMAESKFLADAPSSEYDICMNCYSKIGGFALRNACSKKGGQR